MNAGINPPITIQPGGGLGNQLFVFGTGLSLARHLYSSLRVNCAWFTSQNHRVLELDLLEPDPSIIFCNSPLPFSARITSKVRRSLFGSDGVYRESGPFQFSPAIWNVTPGTTLSGSFQSWKYLDPIATEIRSKVLTAGSPSHWFTLTAEKLSRGGAWTSVHVRRGDYLNSGTKEFHGLVERSYYEKATNITASLEGHRNFVVFSDDVTVAKEIFAGILGHIVFIESPPEIPVLETLRLMAQASACVIANSSFSWWGAWLTDHPGKTVIAPRPWLDNPSTYERDLLPSHWVTIGR
jgi:hypothetical protein